MKYLALLLLAGCTAAVPTPTKVTTLPVTGPPRTPPRPQLMATALATGPTTVAIGYRTTEGTPLSDTGYSVTFNDALPQLTLLAAPNGVSLLQNIDGMQLPIITVPWVDAQLMPFGFFGLITNGVAMAAPVPTTITQPQVPKASSLRLPPINYPTGVPARWALQESEDLVHWHVLARYYDGAPRQESFVPSTVGNRFFRHIGNPWPPYNGAVFQTNRPDLWEKFHGTEQ